MSLGAVRRKEINQDWEIFIKREYLQNIRKGKDISPPEPGSEPPKFSNTEWVSKRVNIPHCWEREGILKGFCGPVWYRKKFKISQGFLGKGKRIVLRFRAVSYYCSVWLNGKRLGQHRGMWDAFEFDITDHLQRTNNLILEVHKPGKHFPLRSCLAGFIPYVTSTFGGIWQEVELAWIDPIKMEQVKVNPNPEKKAVEFEIELTHEEEYAGGEEALISCLVGKEKSTRKVLSSGNSRVEIQVSISHPKLWSLERPHLYKAEIMVESCGTLGKPTRFTRKFGMRKLETNDGIILLNGKPIYPRGVLHWCAYPDLLAPIPSRKRIKDEFIKMKEMGYNLIKFCLVIPPEMYFDIADEMGMMVWVELPMWQPLVNDTYREQAKEEYRAILRKVSYHPSTAIYTLGCELGQNVEEELMEDLYNIAKKETESPLIRDNSGSGECYGRFVKEYADFYDYHFYAEPNFFTDLIDYFLKGRRPKPLLFGEYCDSDTFRSAKEINANKGRTCWWTVDDELINPKGVRWEYNIVNQDKQLGDFPLDIPVRVLKRRSYQQSLEYRKDIVEQTRKHHQTSGYVITNIRDTPISTAGMLDDFDQLKFNSEAFRRFNQDTTLCIERDRRRIWRRGGDRPLHLDEYNFWADSQLVVNLLVSHFGSQTLKKPFVKWSILGGNGRVNLNGELTPAEEITPGNLINLGKIVVDLPSLEAPNQMTLTVNLLDKKLGKVSINSWELNVFPKPKTDHLSIALWDKCGALHNIGELYGNVRKVNELTTEETTKEDLLVVSSWSPWVTQCLKQGVNVFLILSEGDGKLVKECPFWREGINLVTSHPAIDKVPHQGYVGIQFKGITTDIAIRKDALTEEVDASWVRPIITRLDARDFTTSYYFLEAKFKDQDSTLLVTTLKLAGGLGRQPLGLEENVLGAYLLYNSLEYLSNS